MSSSSAAPVRPPAAGRYRIDPGRTTVSFTGRHMFGLGGVSGTFRLRDAELVIGDPLTATTLHAVLDAASFDTGNPKRDTDVRSPKYLGSAAHPDITFAAREVSQRDGSWVATGTVTAHGTAAPVELILDELDDAGGTLTLRAHARIDRYAHGITAGKGLAGRRLNVSIDAAATS